VSQRVLHQIIAEQLQGPLVRELVNKIMALADHCISLYWISTWKRSR
jgi:hypothetical protein